MLRSRRSGERFERFCAGITHHQSARPVQEALRHRRAHVA